MEAACVLTEERGGRYLYWAGGGGQDRDRGWKGADSEFVLLEKLSKTTEKEPAGET